MSNMGQEIYDAERVIVLIETRSGRKIGWEVVPTSAPKWEMTSVGGDGTHARITVGGRFYRKWRDDFDLGEPEIEVPRPPSRPVTLEITEVRRALPSPMEET